MADRIPLSVHYRDGRERLTGFVRAHLDRDQEPVPATPGWTVHDSVAHLTAIAQDIEGGWRPSRRPTSAETEEHVARSSGVPTTEVLERWAAASPAVEAYLDEVPSWAIVLDVGAHEQDVRNALGNRDARDVPLVLVGSKLLLKSLQVPAPLLVRTEGGEVRVGPEDGSPVTLTTTSFEAFRWRLGRRSRRQLAAMDWSGDPSPFLDHLCVFGPARADVRE
jgi:uncharacterized protein (TIGR03083 family)